MTVPPRRQRSVSDVLEWLVLALLAAVATKIVASVISGFIEWARSGNQFDFDRKHRAGDVILQFTAFGDGVTGLLLLLPTLGLPAQNNIGADPLPALVRVLRESKDPQLQLDILRGLSAAFKGRRQVPMPSGWDQVETRLGQSAQADVRALALSLSLTFGSARALEELRNTAADPAADLNARRTALSSHPYS